MLDKVKIKWPPSGMSPQLAMAGGMTMSAPQQEVSLGQVLQMAKSKARSGGKVVERTDKIAKKIKALEDKILRLEPGTAEHRAALWELNRITSGKLSHDHWSKIHESNIGKAKKSNAGATEYQKSLRWGNSSTVGYC